MRSRFAALIAVVAFAATSVNAEVYTMYTAGTPTAPGSMVTPNTSGLGLNINLAGLVTASIPNTAVLPGGTVVTDMNLDNTNSGNLYITGGGLTLANAVYNVPLGFLGSVTATLSGVTFNITGAGPIAVTNGNYVVDSSTPGNLNIYSGTIGLVGTVLGQAINTSIDFNTDPVNQAFSGLGGITIPGTVDDDAGGSDTDTDPHTMGAAGITGLNGIDTDGAEIFINYNGVSLATTIISGTLTLPTTITLTGNASASVPEVGTLALGGLAAVGMGFVAIRRRRAA